MKLLSPLSAVLLDRDGTIIHDRHYLCDPAGVELLPHAAEGLRLLADAGLPLVLVSNQSGIGRGYFSETDAARVLARLQELLRNEGVRLAAAYHCPHRPEEHCTCRKPAAGMALRAARELGFDPARAAVIGDKACDVALARNIGALAVLIQGKNSIVPHARQITPNDTAPTADFSTGNLLEDAPNAGGRSEAEPTPDFIAPDLQEAARWLLAQDV